jgi:hypothetical protein
MHVSLFATARALLGLSFAALPLGLAASPYAFPTEIVAAPAAEQFLVVNVRGSIKNKMTGAALKKGDRLAADTPLTFADANSVAVVVSPSRGRMTLRGAAKSGRTELEGLLRDNLLPPNPPSRLSTRSGPMLSVLNVQEYFRVGGGSLLMLSPTRLTFPVKSFPLTDTSYFFLTYTYKGEKVNKLLPHAGQVVTLTDAAVLEVDGKPISATEATDFSVSYYRARKPQPITSFRPTFVDQAALAEEIRMLAAGARARATERLAIARKAKPEPANAPTPANITAGAMAEISDYLKESYGATAHEEALQLWMRTQGIVL